MFNVVAFILLFGAWILSNVTATPTEISWFDTWLVATETLSRRLVDVEIEIVVPAETTPL